MYDSRSSYLLLWKVIFKKFYFFFFLLNVYFTYFIFFFIDWEKQKVGNVEVELVLIKNSLNVIMFVTSKFWKRKHTPNKQKKLPQKKKAIFFLLFLFFEKLIQHSQINYGLRLHEKIFSHFWGFGKNGFNG